MKVIAKRSRANQNNPLIGYVEPVFIYNEEGQTFKKVDKFSDFPNDGEIFVIKGYNYIESDFEHDELFEIDDIKLNENNYDKDRYGSCLYTVTITNFNLSRLKKWQYIPIYESELNLEKRTLGTISSSQRDRAFFIENNGFLFGPFTNDIVTLSAVSIQYFDLDSESFDDSNNLEELLNEKQDFIFKYKIESIRDVINENYVTDLNLLLKNEPSETIYFGTKEKIIEWGKKAFSTFITLVIK